VDPYTQNGPVIRLQRPSIKELNPAPLQVALLQVMKQRGKNVHVHWFMPKPPYPAYPVVGNLLKQKRKTWLKTKAKEIKAKKIRKTMHKRPLLQGKPIYMEKLVTPPDFKRFKNQKG
jgi:hypothetical protein